MFDDPAPSKDEIVKVADRLEAKTKQRRWTDRTGFLIERDFVLSAYAIRKFVESRKVSDELGQRQIPVRRFELRGDLPDDESGRRKTFSVVDLCHDIVHNRVFVFCCGETEDLFDGIYVASDRHKHKYVHLVLASNYIALCSDVGLDGAR